MEARPKLFLAAVGATVPGVSHVISVGLEAWKALELEEKQMKNLGATDGERFCGALLVVLKDAIVYSL